VSVSEGDREKHFPAIEKKYGEKMAYWFAAMKKLEGKKYPEQIAYLRENYEDQSQQSGTPHPPTISKALMLNRQRRYEK
jgi:hypothetical protein